MLILRHDWDINSWKGLEKEVEASTNSIRFLDFIVTAASTWLFTLTPHPYTCNLIVLIGESTYDSSQSNTR